jgi:two-component SAPR family response regulator
MSLMGGLTLARRIRELRPKILFTSGYEVGSVKRTGWPFLEKPFGMETLKRTVASTLRE